MSRYKQISRGLGLSVMLFAGLWALCSTMMRPTEQQARTHIARAHLPHVRSSFSPKNPGEAIHRAQYERRRLVDPATGKIPLDIRAKELAFARTLPARETMLNKSGSQTFAANWSPRGPFNVGGRTRGLAIDLGFNGTSNRRILAGGISGGIFLSEDNGASWRLTTSYAQLASVTAIAQDPSNRNVWYHSTGEFLGNSAGAFGAEFYGQGVFKSTDGGLNWSQLPSTVGTQSPTAFDSFWDHVWNLALHPQNGAVFAATYGAIFRSTDAGANWTLVLGRQQPPYSTATDVVVGSNGNVFAAMSRSGNNVPAADYGIFTSINNGNQWTDISPQELVQDPYRIALASAPSDPNVLYALVQANSNGATAQDHQFFRYNAGNNSWTNLSASLPNEQGLDGNASFSSQGGYDLLVKVKPDNPNAVWIGGTNLYRSTNGGQSFTRVGGYPNPNSYGSYPNSHADMHSMAFYSNNANAMINGNDGGLSQTTNALEQPQTWTRLNNGYVTSQFYAVAVDPNPGSEVILGGLQDNGTWSTSSSNAQTAWESEFGGDGAFAAIAPGGLPYYVSSQKGNILRIALSGNQLVGALIAPANAQNFLFITPYLLDPNDSRVMYLPAGNVVWRNSNLNDIPIDNANPTSINWSALSNSAINGTQVTALAVSKTPANRLYFGATDYNTFTAIVRVDNAPTNPAGTTITPPAMLGGSYPSCIAVNPNNANEIIVTAANYRVPSVFYSSNGGTSWTDIEGNLAGDEGPSLRWAAIVPTTSGNVYLLATSTGIYSATTLNANNTQWAQEGSTTIGNVVTDMIVARPEDGVVIAATHGRGVYSTKLSGAGGAAVLAVDSTTLSIALKPGFTRSTTFKLSNSGGAALNFNITATGLSNPALGNEAVLSHFSTKELLPLILPQAQTRAHAASNVQTNATSVPALSLAHSEPNATSAADVLILDDGNDTPDDFIGANGANDFYWRNAFQLFGFGFQLESFQFYMRTENASSNGVYVGVLDANQNILVQGNVNLGTAPNGQWYTINLNSPLSFPDLSGFYIVIGAPRAIGFPAGADRSAQAQFASEFFDPGSGIYLPLSVISGFENGAFLIRAVGTKTGIANQPPIANAQVSKQQANVNESITFDGSGSSDPDGQITQYLWSFGDGATSNQAVTTHAYAQAGTYNVSLTVTDDKGATGQASGQITITGGPQSRLTASPTSGTVAPGNAQTITATYNAQGLAVGNYQGELSITSNGGNRVIPVRITVDNNVSVEEETSTPLAFGLEQNYPNPFNPSTLIRFELPHASEVRLAIYNLSGQLVKQLARAPFASGRHQIVWEGKDERGQRAPSGVYVYRLEALSPSGASTMLTKKLTLLK